MSVRLLAWSLSSSALGGSLVLCLAKGSEFPHPFWNAGAAASATMLGFVLMTGVDWGLR